MTEHVTDQQWQQYENDGYLKLGKVLSDADLGALAQRIDDIMLGSAEIDYDKILMQLDSKDGKYENVGAQGRGFKGATLSYRKIQDLEFDPLFRQFTDRPLFKEICEQIYGDETPIACFRAMFMNKPAHQGTLLPWHQDRWTHLDRDPLITIWTALDPATKANGCVQVIPGSHKRGVINPSHGSGFLTPEQAEREAPDSDAIYLELEVGEAVLLHNWLLHRSDTNSTDIARRAYSVCYMDANTIETNGHKYTPLFDNYDEVLSSA